MRRLILAGLLAGAALAQNPNTAVYPGGVVADADLLVASNRATTTLSASATDAALTLTVVSTSLFTVPCVLTIDDERLKATAKTATTFTVTRAFNGSTAASHASGATVRGNIVAHHHNQLAAEVKAVETALGVSFSGANMPATGEKAALPGTSGTPSGTNKYVTDADTRNTDARTPTAHATSHKNTGSDEVAVATAAANAIPKAGAGARLAVGWEPILVNTADIGFFQGITLSPTTNTGTTAAFTANQVKVWQFVLPFAATIGKISLDVTTGSGVCGGTCSAQLGLWSSDLATVAVATGVLVSGGTPNMNVVARYTVSVTAVTLNPGVYNLFMTTDSTVLILRSIAIGASAINPLNDQTVKKWGTCANAAAAGVLPATCGTVSATTTSPVLVTFER